jgi:tetratricopeptide (TPR) repeat protein
LGMKKIMNLQTVWLLVFLCIPVMMFAQKNEIPITTNSKEAKKLFQEGRIKFDNFETNEAALLFDKAIMLDNNFALAYLFRAISGGGFHVFGQNMEKANELAPKVSEGERLIIAYYQAGAEGDGEKRKEMLNNLLTFFPKDKRVQYLAGTHFYRETDYANALFHYQKAIELDQKFPAPVNMKGYAHMALENFPEAEKAFQLYIKLIPDKPAGYDSYAELLQRMGRFDESTLQYQKALKIDPKFSYSLVGIGNNNVFKGNYHSARKYYTEYYNGAKTINDKFEALYWTSVAYVHEGNIDKALCVYDEAILLAEKENLIPDIFNAHLTKANILIEAGNPNEALVSISKAIEVLENSELNAVQSQNLIVRLLLIESYAYASVNNLKLAKDKISIYKQKVDLRQNPNEKMMFYSLNGYIEYMDGNYEQAIENFKNANTESPWNWYFTAHAYNKLGDAGTSAKLCEKIKQCNENSLELALVKKQAMAELNR